MTGLPGIDDGAVPGYSSAAVGGLLPAAAPPMRCCCGGCMRSGGRCAAGTVGAAAIATAVAAESADRLLRGELPPDAWRCMSSGLFSSSCGHRG